jgi:hypothetical protein
MEFRKLIHRVFHSTVMIALALAFSACEPKEKTMSDQISACDEKAERKDLDEKCVVEIAKRTVARRLPGIEYPNYKVTFHPDQNAWIVMAFDEHGPPDNHTFLQIGADGVVQKFGSDK